MAEKPRNFSWFVEGKLAGMGWPYDSELNLEWLRDQGICRLVNLTPMYQEVKTAGIDCTSIPIPDYHPPSMDQIAKFVDVVQTATVPVGVHCAAGIGRTGTMLACYLVAVEHYTAEEAITETKRRRGQAIDTVAQEESVHEFEQYLKEQK